MITSLTPDSNANGFHESSSYCLGRTLTRVCVTSFSIAQNFLDDHIFAFRIVGLTEFHHVNLSCLSLFLHDDACSKLLDYILICKVGKNLPSKKIQFKSGVFHFRMVIKTHKNNEKRPYTSRF